MNILLNKTATPSAPFDGAAQEARAIALATALGHALDTDLAILTQAKADYEGGPFKVLFKLDGTLTAEQWKEMPDHKAETGNNPRFYKTKKIGADGKEKVKDRDYYKVIASNLPEVLAAVDRIEKLNRSMGDATKLNMSDIPQDIKDMSHHRRRAEIGKLERFISVTNRNVPSALELYSQMVRFQGLQGVTMELLFQLDEHGKELDGTEGRAKVIDDTKAPIIITTKLEKRMSMDTTRVGVGGFMKFDIPKAIEQGGSYDALINSVPKKDKEKDKDAASNPKSINTVDTANGALNDIAEFFNRIQSQSTKADWEAMDKSLHGAGSDDAFYNACLIFNSLQLLVGNPKDQVRFQKLFNAAQENAA